MMETYETIRFSLDGGTGRLTLARPERHNAQNPRMWEELRDLGSTLLSDRPLKCLVVAGEGRSFSAGIDLVEGLSDHMTRLLGCPTDDEAIELGLESVRSFDWLRLLEYPTLAIVHGHAYGAGLQLALACDFRVFAESARVGLTEIRYGIIPDMGASWRLPHLIGEARAKEMILLARELSAGEAQQVGLANDVVPDTSLDECESEWIARLTSLPPLAVSAAKRAIDSAWRLDYEAAQLEAVGSQLRCLRSKDFSESLSALAAARRSRLSGT